MERKDEKKGKENKGGNANVILVCFNSSYVISPTCDPNYIACALKKQITIYIILFSGCNNLCPFHNWLCQLNNKK